MPSLFIRGLVLSGVLPILLSACSDSGMEPQEQEPIQLPIAGQEVACVS